MNRQDSWFTCYVSYNKTILSTLIIIFLATESNADSGQSIVSVGHWTKISAISAVSAAIAAFISAFATGAYALFFYRLQKQLNNLTEKNTRDSRLIEISTQWNSMEFVQARNRAFVTIDSYQGSKYKMYEKLVQHGRLDEWNNISLIACFIERLSRLIDDRQIDIRKTRAEFGEGIIWWAKYLAPVHDQDNADRSLVMALKKIILVLEVEARSGTLN